MTSLAHRNEGDAGHVADHNVIHDYVNALGDLPIPAANLRGTVVDSDEYGIDKTGASDASTAINTFLTAGGGKRSVLRKGTYNLLAPIFCPDDTYLHIEPGTVINVDSGNAATGEIRAIKASGTKNINITAYGVTLDGYKTNSNRLGTNNDVGIYMNGVTGFRLLGGTVQNTGGHGIQTNGTTEIHIQDVTVLNAGKSGASAGGSGIAISQTADMDSFGTIDNCYVSGSLRCGIKLGSNPGAPANDIRHPFTVRGCRATGCGLDGSSSGFQAEGIGSAGNQFYFIGVMYSECHAWANTNAGFEINNGVRHFTAQGCRAWENGTHGFFLSQGIQYSSFTGCHAWNNGQTTPNTYSGFKIDSSSLGSQHNRFVACTSADHQGSQTQKYAFEETSTAGNTDNLYSNCGFFPCASGTVLTGTPYSGDAAAPLLIVAAADDPVPVNNSTTVKDDPELFATVQANTTYEMVAVIYYDTDATTADFRAGFSGPSGASMTWAPLPGPHVSATTSGAVPTSPPKLITDTQTLGGAAAGGGSVAYARLEGLLIVTTGGTFKFRYAQAALLVGNTTRKAGSYLKLKRIK